MAKSRQLYFRRQFALFLRENFRSPAHIADTFGVRERTALTWLHEESRASGDIVMHALMCPELRDVARTYFEDAA